MSVRPSAPIRAAHYQCAPPKELPIAPLLSTAADGVLTGNADGCGAAPDARARSDVAHTTVRAQPRG